MQSTQKAMNMCPLHGQTCSHLVSHLSSLQHCSQGLSYSHPPGERGGGGGGEEGDTFRGLLLLGNKKYDIKLLRLSLQRKDGNL